MGEGCIGFRTAYKSSRSLGMVLRGGAVGVMGVAVVSTQRISEVEAREFANGGMTSRVA